MQAPSTPRLASSRMKSILRDSRTSSTAGSHRSSGGVPRTGGVPDDPWLENNWNQMSDVYLQLRRLYSSYFDRIHRVEGEDRALIDLILCQLNCFVGVDALLDRKLLLLLVNSFGLIDERYLHRDEFIRLMFFLCFASKEQLEEAVFNIVSMGQSRVTVGQLVHMHSYCMQRLMSSHVINLISECDRSGCGLLDVFDFRLLIGKLQEMEKRECVQQQPPVDRERAKLEEALLEANDLLSWSWDIGEPNLRNSSQLRTLVQCRTKLEMNPSLAEAMSKLAWDYPEILCGSFVRHALDQHHEKPSTLSSHGSRSSNSDTTAS